MTVGLLVRQTDKIYFRVASEYSKSVTGTTRTYNHLCCSFCSIFSDASFFLQ
ncbi:hypothetical protein CY34DRAFT_798746 [Suillus luteus UH-Slu-Lm8-n1]|uniref:Uncharacterized protein n=1 Tax=Suillus luteus UH-Slu-Lm8-n1 TaxID=930992 RepID=A0A0D0BDI5_9AGAM|nr:hypothetical protein CY34DRAFT_798746 [Suillus luteus UH-Slu-Lm8-n1]